ncbi:MAG: MATE family efflux transporter [bacterium]
MWKGKAKINNNTDLSKIKKTKNTARLIDGPVGKTLVRLTIPMVFGIVGMVAFNLADTFFVSKLGTNELAALSFTFPVVLIINSLALGIGIGASVVISRAIGEGDQHRVKRLTTDSLVLAMFIVTVFVVAGLFTINSVFRILGARGEILDLVKQYMGIWYFGMPFVVVPMVGNNAIRATGDTKTPSAIMLVAVCCNFIMDPLLIFGIGPFPRLGIAGAAIATVISRSLTFIISLAILFFRDKMLTFVLPKIKEIFQSWKRILFIGLPTASTRIVVPLGIGVVTRIVSTYGKEAVAAYGVSSRIEFFALTVIAALSSVLSPFIGQNWGARKHDRVRLGVKYSERFSVVWGIAVCIILNILARPIALIFNSNPLIISTIILYLRIVSIGYGLQGIIMITGSAMNVLNKPFHAAGIRITQMFILYIPMALLGSYLFGLTGVFIALVIAYCSAGLASYFILDKIIINQISNINTY